MNLTNLWLLPALGAAVGAAGPLAAQEDSAERAWRLYEAGDLDAAAERARTILAEDGRSSRARHLRIVSSFLAGSYEESLAQYLLLDREYEHYDSLSELIAEAYLHLGRFREAAAYSEAAGASELIVRHLREQAEKPLTLELERTTVIGFLEDAWLAGMMPAIPIELNGVSMPGYLDTGGSYLHMSPKKARDLGIETAEYGEGVGNAQRTNVTAGIADTLRLGDASFTNVPVYVIDSLAGQAEELVILGTRILSSFLVTWDNDRGRLVLTPRGVEEAVSSHYEQYASGGEEMRFYLAGDHYMWARGVVGDHAVLFFVDTGLVTLDEQGRQPGLSVPRDVLESWELTPGAASFLDVPGVVRLGPAEQEGGSLMVSGDRRNLVSFQGLQPEALISHGFLKDFVWTIDFDRRVYRLQRFVRSAESTSAEGKAASAELGGIDLQSYVGSYELAPGVALEVTTGDRGLLLQAPGQQKIPMTSAGEPDTFEIELAGATIRFVRDDAGAVVELVLIQGGLEQKARKAG